MKKNYLFATILLVILLLISCIPNSVYAGYDENSMAKKQVSENNIKLTKIIEYTDSNKTSNIDNQTIIKIPFEEIEHTDFNEIKQIMKEKNASVLIGYKTLPLLLEKISTCNINIDIRAINEMIENEDEFIKKYNENGLMDLRLEDDNQLYPGGFFTKAYRDDNIIRNYNIFKGYITMDIVEGTEKITEKPTPRFIKGNYELRFYWSDSTSFNKIYASPRSDSNIVVNLYRSEMIQNLGTTSERTYQDSYGGIYYEYFDKVQANNSSGTLTTGYYLSIQTYDPRNGDEGFGGNNLFAEYCYTLKDLLESAYRTDYKSARSAGHVFCADSNTYGVRIKTASNLYNSSGGWLKSAPVNSVVWVNKSNKCGYSNPQYMTITLFSKTSSALRELFTSTTFVDAGLLTAHPSNYKIDVRWF